VRIWSRFSLVSFTLALIVAIAGCVVWKSFFSKYRAEATLQVAAQMPRVLFRTDESDRGVDDSQSEYRRYQATQLTLIKSKFVLNAALQYEGVSKFRMVREQYDPIGWLEHALEVEFLGNSEVLEIALTGDNPVEIAGLVNAVKKAYMDEVVNLDARRRADRLARLKKLKQTYEDMLRERRETVRKLSVRIGGRDDERTSDPVFSSQVQIFVTKSIQLGLDRAEAETLLERRKKSAGADTEQGRKEIVQLEDRLAIATAREKDLNGKRDQFQSVSTLDLEPLREEIAVMEDTHHKIAAEVEALNVELDAPARIRTIQDAVPPKSRGDVTAWGW
jgi:hypothetical protein